MLSKASARFGALLLPFLPLSVTSLKNFGGDGVCGCLSFGVENTGELAFYCEYEEPKSYSLSALAVAQTLRDSV